MTSVLIADSYPDGAESLAWVLRYQGYHVTVALDGRTALDLARAESPDVVVTELNLNRVTGWEVARSLQEDGSRPRPLLIALTASSTEGYRRAAFEAGFDYFLLKPAHPKRLESVLPPPSLCSCVQRRG